MDDDGSTVASRGDRDVKSEQINGKHHDKDKDTSMADPKPTYKSWKKKYRKMRVTFDHKMHDCEDLHKQEQKALAMAKRIALENDRILDLLLDLNQSDQIPLDKRINIALTPPDSDDTIPDVEHSSSSAFAKPARSLEELMKEIPHTSFSQAKERFPAVVADMEPFEGEEHPPTFLTPDDLDDYLYEIDRRMDDQKLLPTLAPSARPNAGAVLAMKPSTSQNIALRNPTSVYNWLRKHAPKTFLQDGEASAAADKDELHPEETPAEGKRKRRSAVGPDSSTKATRGGKGSRGGKRRSTAADRAIQQQKEADGWDASHDEMDISFSTPVPSASARGGKRKRDDDGGYRPKGGSGTRPTKKKRKSTGDGDGEISTPTTTKGAGGRRAGKARASEGAKSKASKGED